MLVYYNEDISGEEMTRRWSTLDLGIVRLTADYCNALALAPRPESWHKWEDVKFTQEMWDSIDSNWWDRVEAIQDIPDIHLDKRREAFQPFWKQQRESWEQNLATQLLDFKKQNERLGRFTISELLAKEMQPKACLATYNKGWSEEVDLRRLEGDKLLADLNMELSRACRENKKEEIYALFQKKRTCEEAIEKDVRAITLKWSSWKKDWERELAFYRECTNWMRSANSKLNLIRSQARQELKKMEKVQEREFNELFPPTIETEADPEPEELNEAIAVALANHALKQSPADCPSPKGYGDSVESTQSEKNVANSRNLLGIRGLEAVQVSSHRGPPTDRPPDKPPPCKGASRGCPLERAGTRHAGQLASFSRSSHCSSGNATPLQTFWRTT
jgi:hypothetical protein